MTFLENATDKAALAWAGAWHAAIPAWYSSPEMATSAGALVAYTLGNLCLSEYDQRRPGDLARRFYSAIGLVLAAAAGPGGLAWAPYGAQQVIKYLELFYKYQTKGAPNGEYFAFFARAPWYLIPQWWHWAGWLGGAALGGGLWWLLHRYFPAKNENVKQKLRIKTAAAREERTDIRTVGMSLPQNEEAYAPEQYFLKGRLFFGLDADGQPIYAPYPPTGSHPHMQITGTTGCGKGVAATIYMVQCLIKGEGVFALDPKDDPWAPQVLRAWCERLGKKFYLIDLRKDCPQVNILAGASAREREEMLIAGLGLSDQGEPASDFYRVADRRAAKHLIDSAMKSAPQATLSDLAEAAEALLGDTAKGLVGRLAEAAEGAALSATAGGADLLEIAQDGGAVYIIGGSEGRLTVMQRMLVVRIQHLAASRPAGGRQLLLFLDEVKDLLSKPALDALAKVRSAGLHIILAHQSLGDLDQVPGFQRGAVRSAVLENCRWTVRYGVGDADTAKWLADSTGTVLVDDESREVETSAAGVEQATGRRQLRQAEVQRVPPNAWLALRDRPGVAVVNVGQGPRFGFFCHLRVKRQPIPLAEGQRSAAKPRQEEKTPAAQPPTDHPSPQEGAHADW